MSSQLTPHIAEEVHEVITAMCANPGRSFSKEAHAAPLYKILPKSKIPKKTAELFVEVTTFTAAFTEIRTTESMNALKELCAIKGAVVDNLLHCIANMSDSEQTQTVIDVAGVLGGSKSRTSKVSFKSQRKLAQDELAKRGSPAYDIANYAGK